MSNAGVDLVVIRILIVDILEDRDANKHVWWNVLTTEQANKVLKLRKERDYKEKDKKRKADGGEKSPEKKKKKK